MGECEPGARSSPFAGGRSGGAARNVACVRPSALPRNDVRQYDSLVDTWWDPYGPLAMLRWLAAARAALIPPAPPNEEALLVDLGCGGGLLAPHARRLGYRHLGVDLSEAGLGVARQHGVLAVRADAARIPLPAGVADAVSAGEILEHVADPAAVVREACRVLRPGGRLVIDTLARTPLARLVAVTIGERVPGGPPPGIHDPKLFVDRAQLRSVAAAAGVTLTLRGIRPAAGGMLKWLTRRDPEVRMVPTWSTAVLFQAYGNKT
jgi:2-polyprenyl-6-hydroxyphenyl methylase/3-demethylubiquinone-9 3-methyltransferase